MKISKPNLKGGVLEETPVPILVAGIQGLKKTGALIMQSGDMKKAIFFKSGLPVAVRSNILNETLARYLSNQDIISSDIAEECLNELRASQRPEIEILSNIGVLSPEELQEYQDKLFKDKFTSVFSWQEGSYIYKDAAAIDAEIDPNNLNIIELLDLGLRQNYDLERLKEEVEIEEIDRPNGGSLLTALINGDNQMGEDERDFISRMDGKHTLADLISETEINEMRAYVMTYLSALLNLMDEKKLRTVKLEHSAAADRAKPGTEPKKEEPATPEQPPKEEPIKPAGGVRTNINLTEEAFQKEYERIKKLNFYEIMAVPPDFQEKQLKKAYFSMSKFYHPDKFYETPKKELAHVAQEIFTLINKAYITLKDPQKREDYQIFMETGRTKEEISTEAQDAFQAELKFMEGLGHLKKRNYADAIEAFSWALQLKGDQPEYLLEMAYAKIMEGRRLNNRTMLNEAQELLEKVVSIDKTVDKTYFYMALLEKDTNPEKAQELYKTAVKFNPNNIEAQREIRLYEMRKLKDKKKTKG